MFYVINHEITNENAPTTFTFKGEGNRQIGEIVLCQTCRGNRLGRIVKIIEETQVDFVPTARICKLNAGRRRNALSAYDRAMLVYVETQDAEKALECFNGYSDKNQIMAFAYNVLDADNVSFKNQWGCTTVVLNYFGYYKDGAYYGNDLEYCFG